MESCNNEVSDERACYIVQTGPVLYNSGMKIVEITGLDSDDTELTLAEWSSFENEWTALALRESMVEVVEAIQQKRRLDVALMYVFVYKYHHDVGCVRLGRTLRPARVHYIPGYSFRFGCRDLSDKNLKKFEAWIRKHAEIVEA